MDAIERHLKLLLEVEEELRKALPRIEQLSKMIAISEAKGFDVSVPEQSLRLSLESYAALEDYRNVLVSKYEYSKLIARL